MSHIDIATIAAPTIDLTNKGLVPEVLWNRLVGRIVIDEEMPRELAERIMDQTLGYLKLASTVPEGHFSPSPLVDIGWHTFILYTREYSLFCREITGGKFIHHEPTDDPNVPNESSGPYATAEAMKSFGLSVDEPLWACFCKSDCSNCNGGQGCQCGSCKY
jgi:hypothetical protein